MLIVTNSIVVLILNSLLLPITEGVRECTGWRIIIAYVMYYSKKCILLLQCWMSGRLRERKNKVKDLSVIHKSGRGRLLEWPHSEGF